MGWCRVNAWDLAGTGLAACIPLSCVCGLAIGRAIRALTPQTPAGGEVPRELPRTAADSPLPGLTWVHDVRYREAGCGCFEVINHIHRTRRRRRCERHAFEAHWEARLTQ
jgi:hypothetical protein